MTPSQPTRWAQRRTLAIVATLALAILLAGCGGSDSQETLIPEGNLWHVVQLRSGGQMADVVSGTDLTLDMTVTDQASGSAGCNTFSGTYMIDGNAITFGPLATTLMACADEAVNQQETAYLAALGATSGYRIVGDQMEFNDSGQQVLITFEAD